MRECEGGIGGGVMVMEPFWAFKGKGRAEGLLLYVGHD